MNLPALKAVRHILNKSQRYEKTTSGVGCRCGSQEHDLHCTTDRRTTQKGGGWLQVFPRMGWRGKRTRSHLQCYIVAHIRVLVQQSKAASRIKQENVVCRVHANTDGLHDFRQLITEKVSTAHLSQKQAYSPAHRAERPQCCPGPLRALGRRPFRV